MGKGILLEMEGRRAVVLTPQGEFKRVPVPAGNWETGDEVTFADTQSVPWARWGMVAAAAVLMLLIVPIGYQNWALAQPYAIVTIDINPSVQLTLNKADDVLEAKGLNADGSMVLEGLHLKGLTVGDAVSQVTARAVAVGKLDPSDENGAVVVAVAPAKLDVLPQKEASQIAGLSKTAVSTTVEAEAKAKATPMKAHIAVVEANLIEVKQAEEKNISVGKLVIIQTIQEKAPEVKLESNDKFKTGKTILELGLNLGTIFGEAEKNHGVDSHKGNEDKNTKPVKDNGSNGPGKDKPGDNAGGKDQKGQGNNDNGKVNATGSGGSEVKPKDNGPGAPEKDQGDKGKDQGDKGKDQGDKGKDQGDKGKDQGDKGKDQGDKGKGNESGQKQADSKSSDTWKVPFLPIEIPKPSFLRPNAKKKDDASKPRAEESGDKALNKENSDKNSTEPPREKPKEKAEDKPKEKEDGKNHGKGGR